MLGLPVSLKKFGLDLKDQVTRDYVFNGAAALAYYLMLALFPAIIFFLTLLPYLPIADLQKAVLDFMNQALPADAASVLGRVINDLLSNKQGGLLSFGLLGTLWAATTGIVAVMTQLNITYRIEETRSFLKVRGTALLLMLVFSLLMITAFALIIGGGVLESYLANQLGWGTALVVFFATLRWIIIFAMITLVFATIYYLGPNVEQKFKFISPGSVTGAVLIAIASLGFRWYASNFGNYDKTYGSIGGVIVLMLWLYILGLVLLIGAEVNALIEHYHPEGKDTKAGIQPLGRPSPTPAG